MVRKAIRLGARPVAPLKTVIFLRGLLASGCPIELITYPSDMGENEAKEVGLAPKTIGSIPSGMTTAKDTIKAARRMKELGAALIIFVGGDGTARDVLKAVGTEASVLGVPSGVKSYSGVFAVNPSAAAKIAIGYLSGELPVREAEVLDVDEEAYRDDRLSAKLYGYLMVPFEPSLVQGSKSATPAEGDEMDNQKAIARYVVESMEPDTLYILGPGTTAKAIADMLGVKKALLGVDAVKDGKLVLEDANERALLQAIEGRRAKIMVAPIGRQGFIFGRGNQQISPEVIEKVGRENILVVATHSKLRGIDALRVDTGSEKVDGLLRGYIRVITDYREEKVKRVL